MADLVDWAAGLAGVKLAEALPRRWAHVQGGLSEELAEFEDERTAVRDALWWADMTTTPDGEETTAAERVAEIQSRYGPDDLVSRFIRRAWHDLRAAVERTERRLVAAGIG